MAFLNDGSFFEQFQRLQQTSEIPSAAEERTQIEEAIPPTIEKGQAFAAAASFSTEQPGYFFGTGRDFGRQLLFNLLARAFTYG